MTLQTVILGCGLLAISLGLTVIKDRLDRIANALEEIAAKEK